MVANHVSNLCEIILNVIYMSFILYEHISHTKYIHLFTPSNMTQRIIPSTSGPTG